MSLLLLPALLVARYLAGRRPASVERLYSHGLYPPTVRALGGLTGLIPVSLAEALLLFVAVAVIGLAAQLVLALRAERGRRGRILGRAAVRAMVAAAFVYGWFLVVWGLNYARLPFASAAGLDVHPAPLEELAAASRALVDEANALRVGLPEDPAGVATGRGGVRGILMRAPEGLRRARRDGATATATVLIDPVAAPKPALFSPLMSYLGITGIYSPFTGEAHVNRTVPMPDLPFDACHELAHQAGVAREDEANYVGYVSCRAHPDQDFRYSGALSASIYLMNALARADRRAWPELEARRSPAVRRDLQALVAWSARYRGPVERASRAMNDAYLRSQGQAQGVASYGRMVDLLLAERRRSRSAR